MENIKLSGPDGNEKQYSKRSKKNKLVKYVPKDLWAKYTMNGQISVINWLFDQTENKNTIRIFKKQDYETVFKSIKDGTFTYYGETLGFLLSALEKYSIAGKTVCVFGAESINCDAISLVHGAEKVYIIDYNPIISEHPLVEAYNYETIKDKKVDIGISISSFEHDGLGRYGDKLCPNGDLKTMKKIKKIIKKDGLLFLSVPVGPDCLVWNAHRIYGKIRLPMLIKDWECIDIFSEQSITLDGLPSAWPVRQPVLVLKNK